MKQAIITSTLILLIIALLIGCSSTSQVKTQGPGEEIKIINEISDLMPEKVVIPFSEVTKHDVTNDCWLAIDGKVYDVSKYTVSHPGGKAILEGCGTDATELYETRPMGSGTPHSTNARERLAQYYIGDLE